MSMHHLRGLKLPRWKCMVLTIDDGQEQKEMRNSVANWLESNWQTALARRWGDCSGMGWQAGGEKVAQALEQFHLNWLTIFFKLDLLALMFPIDGGWWWTGHIADYVSIIAFIEFLWAGSILEGDFFCRKTRQVISAYKYLIFQTDTLMWHIYTA